MCHLPSLANDGARVMHGQRRGGSGGPLVMIFLCECASEINLAHDLLRQAKDQSWIPFQFLVLQGNGKESSADHVGVQPCKCDHDPAIELSTYV